MKTPMQELIDEMQKSPLMFASALTLVEKMRMLEKEKEVIKNAYIEGCGDNILCESTDKKRAEEYYNETFNTNQENLQDSTNGYTYYPQEYKTVFNTKEK